MEEEQADGAQKGAGHGPIESAKLDIMAGRACARHGLVRAPVRRSARRRHPPRR